MPRLTHRWSLRSAQSKARRLASATRPALVESLENRTMLTTVVVNTTIPLVGLSTTGLIGIEDAIAIADNSTKTTTTITFDPTIFAGSKKTIAVADPLEIGNGNFTIAPVDIIGPAIGVSLADAIVTVDPGVKATISNVDFPMGLTGGSITVSASTTSTSGATLPNASLTMSNGTVDNGAGILNAGGLTLTNVSIINNTAGGINGNNSSGYTTLTDCTVANNTGATEGGGIYNLGDLTAVNSTIADNTATEAGGGIYNDVGNITVGNATVFVQGKITLINVTVADNQAGTPGTIPPPATVGGGIANVAASINVTLGNTIIADNSADVGNDVYGGFNSEGHNLIGDSYASTGWNNTDYLGSNADPLDPNLGALNNNGGPTLTMQPLVGSPAIDHGYNALISGVTTDQRGQPRIYTSSGNANVDIGAVEGAEEPVISVTATAAAGQTAVVGQNPSTYFALGSFTEQNAPGPFTVTVNWGDGTANSVFSMSSPGTIPAQPHVYTAVGDYTVTITVQDAAKNYPCDTSNSPTFGVAVSLPQNTASINGNVYEDLNDDGADDPGDPGMGSVMVYLDTNDSGKLDEGDPTCITDSNGDYGFTGLFAGTYHVREVIPAGYAQTAPLDGYDVTLTSGQAVTGQVFMDAPVSGSTEQAVYRLYCTITDEHLYTSDLNEYATLATRGYWIQEGVAYYDYSGPATVDGVTDEPLYRLYNTASQQHLWTTDVNEWNTLPITQGWQQEGVVGYVFPSAVAGTAPNPLYRLSLATPALHLWTADQNEYNTLIAQDGWDGEGVVCYVL